MADSYSRNMQNLDYYNRFCVQTDYFIFTTKNKFIFRVAF
jgi:hypothetical protein